MAMKALEIVEPNVLKLKEVGPLTPLADEVIINVEAAGICGTDLRILQGGYGHVRGFPLIPGHEFAGTIAALGENVTGFSVGDRVTADPNIYCLKCDWCKQGAYNHCEHAEAVGVTRAGALATQVAVPAFLLVPIPQGISFALAALAEPLSCVLNAEERAMVGNSGKMLVVGAGTIGLLAVAIFAQKGLDVAVSEPAASRCAVAEAMGASVVQPGTPAYENARYDYVLDASGVTQAIRSAIGLLRKRGTYIQMGVAVGDMRVEISPYDLYARELRYIGSYSVADKFAPACAALPDLANRLQLLLTHEFPLSRYEEAFDMIRNSEGLKIGFNPTLEE